jgi:tetratricopeptide (TPR) repeat protein
MREPNVMINERRALSRFNLRAIRFTLYSFLLTLLLVESIAAQPGPMPTVEETQKQLQPQFDELAAQLKQDRLKTDAYIRRSVLYMKLYRMAGYNKQDGYSFAEQALADLSLAIELNPTTEAYVARAWWYQTTWPSERQPANSPAKAMADFYLKYSRFTLSETDLFKALSVSKNEEQLSKAYGALSGIYAARAQLMLTPTLTPEMRARAGKYSPWDDFDRCIEYGKKWLKYAPPAAGMPPTFNAEQFPGVYHVKGRAAYEVGELDIASSAFEAGSTYLTGNYFEVCSYYMGWGDTYVRKKQFSKAIEVFTQGLKANEWNCRLLLERRGDAYVAEGELHKALQDYIALSDKMDCCKGGLLIKRAKVHLKLKEPQKALDEINEAFNVYYILGCPKVLLLRAEVYRLLGELGRAQEDEQRAAKLGTDYCPEN